MVDVWNGELLADASVVKDDIHYRVTTSTRASCWASGPPVADLSRR